MVSDWYTYHYVYEHSDMRVDIPGDTHADVYHYNILHAYHGMGQDGHFLPESHN